MKTEGTPLSPGTVPRDYVPRKGDVFTHPILPSLVITRFVHKAFGDVVWYTIGEGAEQIAPADEFAEMAATSPFGVTLTRAPE